MSVITANSTEEALKERIKELTCLYEVSSIIVNATEDQMEEVLKAIALCIKKGFRNPKWTEVEIETLDVKVATGKLTGTRVLTSPLMVFNESKGSITASLKGEQGFFLKEEQPLLDNIAIKIGNLLEKLEIQRNEKSLKRQMERAGRLAILGEITAGIAHELNTPLANILGFAELLKSDLESKSLSTDDVDKIIHNSIFTREVVKKLMFFACEMPHEKNEVNIIPHLKSAIDLLHPTFKKEEIKYIVKIESEEIWLKADVIQLTQIMFNLIMNAIYFSPKNGLVTIELYEHKKNIVLSVSDQGKGIDDSVIDKLFEPFFTTKPIGEGSGLGLSVVHGIVASHKGSITAKNMKKGGANFTVKIPKGK